MFCVKFISRHFSIFITVIEYFFIIFLTIFGINEKNDICMFLVGSYFIQLLLDKVDFQLFLLGSLGDRSVSGWGGGRACAGCSLLPPGGWASGWGRLQVAALRPSDSGGAGPLEEWARRAGVGPAVPLSGPLSVCLCGRLGGDPAAL